MEDPEVVTYGPIDPQVLLDALRAELQLDPDNEELIQVTFWLRIAMFQATMRELERRRVQLDADSRCN